MREVSFTIILSFRNREFQRLEKCLYSLLNQTYTSYEVILVDYGSEKDLLNKIINFFKNLPEIFQLICHAGQGHFWNRAHALNIGSKEAKGDYLIFGDIDMIYPRKFITSIAENIDPMVFVNYRCFYLRKNHSGLSLKDIDNLNFANKKFESSSNASGLLAVSRSIFSELGGYDESFCVWGFEDNDLLKRLLDKGIDQKWLTNSMDYVYHQWHKFEKPVIEPNFWYLTMCDYFFSKIINTQSEKLVWGKCLQESERFIFKDFKFQTSITLPIVWNFDYWNAFIDAFYRLKNNAIIEIKHKPLTYKGNNSILKFCDKKLINNKSRIILIRLFGFIKSRRYVIEKDVLDFFSWFINTHKKYINDYNISVNDGITTVRILKK
ncbi:MAG: glycosyltransferase [Bacteroidales bacterium]